jgi:hypothetical protein
LKLYNEKDEERQTREALVLENKSGNTKKTIH